MAGFPGRARPWWMAAMAGLVVAAATAAPPASAATQTAGTAAVRPTGAAAQQPGFWVTNEPVRASLLVGSTLYIGGDFTYEGPPTGHPAAPAPSTGAARPPVPRVRGPATATHSPRIGPSF